MFKKQVIGGTDAAIVEDLAQAKYHLDRVLANRRGLSIAESDELSLTRISFELERIEENNPLATRTRH